MSAHDSAFARRTFRGAAIYGVLVLLPMYALAPIERADAYYGFVGCALVFQWLFWIIAGDPARYRSLMLPAVAEKLVYALPALALAALSKVPPIVVPFALIDLLFAAGFLIARGRTPA